MVVMVIVRDLKGGRTAVHLCDTQEQFQTLTARDLARKILEKFPDYSKIPEPDKVLLIFTDKRLDDANKLLSEYGIQDKSTIHTILSFPGGGSAPEKGDGGMGDKEGKNRRFVPRTDGGEKATELDGKIFPTSH